MATRLCSCTLSLLLLLLSLKQSPLHASDTLTTNQQLSGNQKLISQDGSFALGFFQPAAEGSNGKWYIGIWYNKIPEQTIVWVANREKPISDPVSSSLTISDDGNFVLLVNHSKSPIWSTNIKNTDVSSTVAVLLNNGNLLVRHESNTSAVLWQSFDDFTDTWLPGNKLSRNKKTGVIKRMISWKDRGDPAPGMFSIQLDPNGSLQYILQWNSSVVYWTTGNWTNKTGFIGVPEMSPMNPYPSSRFIFQFVDNDEEAYLTYYIKNDALLFTRTIIDVSGLFQTLVWAEAQQAWTIAFTKPKAKCSVYGVCGEYSKCNENAASPCSCLKGFSENRPNSWKLDDQTTGCRRNIPLQCGNNGSVTVKHDRFYAINGVKLPDNAQSIDATNVHDCELICLNNCSCTAYSHSGTCLVWYNHLMNLQDNIDGSSDGIFIRVAASELSNSEHKKLWLIGIIIGGFIVLIFGVAILYFLHRRRTITNGLNHVDGSLISFKYSNLQLLTRNFSERLGAGSFGSVFKGVVSDTTAVAVKKLEGFHQGEKQFRTEVSTIGNIHHINLIRLLGFCSEGVKRLLVYEYMPNGSLDKHLFGCTTLSWKMRYQIAVGIAKGLAYLHEECRDFIIHCDIKPENILLDASFVPKVADFGMAKLLGRDFSKVLTSMRGTIGYLAPEWISGEAITTKADVFSYGMVLFEIISGRRNLEHRETSMETFFPVLVARKLLEGEVQGLLAEGLINGVDEREPERACKVACWCVQGNESSRPTMGEIVKILEGVIDVDMPPVPRYLEVLPEGSESVKFFSYEATK
ncbi:G-type lectin S-receptor-like serine/threonine-protein kinase At2g19130 [Panicum virgatum]|uniref:G-type lectin S-receptor-like serine/threonine-protein kinase At2g19130 n=1 Tax=Panicum virgatum TaxID=38727 RepID=UPI0019D59C37|nr:G-type lectin S-receptor-like serine/threonine-protein kinase At2g19130 [Panicum virgatum]